MSQSLSLPGQRQDSPPPGFQPMAPALDPFAGSCWNCDGFTPAVIRIDGSLISVDCPVCTPGVSQ